MVVVVVRDRVREPVYEPVRVLVDELEVDKSVLGSVEDVVEAACELDVLLPLSDKADEVVVECVRVRVLDVLVVGAEDELVV